jgi:hypothetical protein
VKTPTAAANDRGGRGSFGETAQVLIMSVQENQRHDKSENKPVYRTLAEIAVAKRLDADWHTISVQTASVYAEFLKNNFVVRDDVLCYKRNNGDPCPVKVNGPDHLHALFLAHLLGELASKVEYEWTNLEGHITRNKGHFHLAIYPLDKEGMTSVGAHDCDGSGHANPQGKRITRGKLVKMGKGVSKDAFSKILRKQGVFEIRPYNRLIVLANIVSGDIPMSLEKSLEN